MSLTQIRSHDQAIGVIQRAFEAEKLHHAWLLSGPGGVGKSLLAKEIGRLLVCESPGPGPDSCGTCRSCKMVDASGHPDLIWVTLQEGKSRIAVEQVRELRALLDYPPHGNQGRAVLFEKADLMSEEAQNALLKTLEEPTGRTYLFLTTSQPSRLLPTVRSRCSRLELGGLPPDTLAELIDVACPGLDDVTRSLAINLSSGSVTSALALTERGLPELTALVDQLDRTVEAGDVPRLLQIAEEMAKDKDRLRLSLDLVALWYRDVLRQAAGQTEALAFSHNAETLERRAAALGVSGASSKIAAALEATEAISRRNANPRLTTETMLLRMIS